MASKTHFFERPELGLLILRLLLGGMMIAHGAPKLKAGPQRWEWLGGQMTYLGIDFLPVFWGFSAALAETLGGALLIIGFYMRTATFFLLGTMLVATLYHIKAGHGFAKIAHPLELSIVFISLMFMGPGKYTLKKNA